MIPNLACIFLVTCLATLHYMLHKPEQRKMALCQRLVAALCCAAKQ